MGKWRSTKCPACHFQGNEREVHNSERTCTGKKGVYRCRNRDCRVDTYVGDSKSEKEDY